MTEDVIDVVGVERRGPRCVLGSGHYRVLHVADTGRRPSLFISVLLYELGG